MTDFWKRKLAAYLHDPPSKALDIKTHGERSDAAFRQAGFVDSEIGEYFAHADHTGAAADRFPFPRSQMSGLHCAFDGVRNAFLHPLSGDKLPFHAEFKSVEQGFEGENSVQPALTNESLALLKDDNERWRARFFAHWRLWPQHAMERDYRLALLPADTRIPDHTIWTHMQVVSALAGCVGEDKVWQPAFLKFQLGPVQEFIAAARSTRDLWSGSYLLSWLMAVGLKALSAAVGPDVVIFPNLRGQPLFDLQWKTELWDVVQIGSRSVWETIEPKDKMANLLTPNFPNIFLALVPANRAGELAHAVKRAIREEFAKIARSVWQGCEAAGLTDSSKDSAFENVDRHERFERQVEQFLSLSWQITPWPGTIDEVLEVAALLPVAKDDGEKSLRERVVNVIEATTERMPVDHRDRRYYTDDSKTKLNNVGVMWALLVAANSWQLDAVRQTRDYRAWNAGGWQVGTASNKDSLTGRDEAVAGGSVWLSRCNKLAGRAEGSQRHGQHGTLANRFKHDDWLGAVTLIKRLWDLTYLKREHDLDAPRMPSTRGIAAHEPFSDDDGEEGEGEKYFAVLALDGDQIGRWVAGDNCPPFGSQLADYKDGSGNPQGARIYFDRHLKNLLVTRRPVSPSYHLQFSESLSNFALLCARPVVEAFDGRLIYAGGDDVLALLPADGALACSGALRAAFTGKEVKTPGGRILFSSPAPGFLCSDSWKDDHGRGHPIPFLVPGPATDCSVGIAISHFKSPLQDVVRAARAAENKAKRKLESGGLGRKAVAVTLMKRSGEIIEWGFPWEGGGLQAFAAISEGLRGDVVSGKFPHRIVELVDGYQTNGAGQLGGILPAESFDDVVDEILGREIATAAERQRGLKYSAAESQKICDEILAYLASSALPDAARKVRALTGLCQTVAFAHRTSND